MTAPETHRNPVEELAEEFLARYRCGERPALTEYTDKHPELAEDIRDLFPALVLMEEAGPRETGAAGACGPVTATGQALERLGDFCILREVGRGGMGVVYEAVQESLGRHVALKVLPFAAGSDITCLKRFRREARSVARLHHTNIVPVFEVGECRGTHYYAMQFIQGQGLDQVLQELRPLRGDKASGGAPPTPPEGAAEAPAGSQLTVSLAQGLQTGRFAAAEPGDAPEAPCPAPAVMVSGGPVGGAGGLGESPATDVADRAVSTVLGSSPDLSLQSDYHYYRSVARLGLQAAEALAYAHGQKVLHRDIKPANLLLDLQGTLWVTDFGLAKVEGEDFTRTGDLVGTVRYMAPERFQGQTDARSDLYSLGATLYELLTLRPAFGELDRGRLIKQVAHDEPPRPSKLDHRVPRDLETIVLKAMAKEPGRRYPSAKELAEDLRLFLADRPIRARRSGVPEHAWRWCRRNPAVATLSALALALLVAIAVISSVAAVRLKGERDQVAQQREQAEIAREAEAAEKSHALQAEKDAVAERDTATAIRLFLEDILDQTQPANQVGFGQVPDLNLKLRTVLDRASSKIDDKFQDQPFVKASLHRTIGDAYYSIGEAALARRHLEQALVLARQQFGELHSHTLDTRVHIAMTFMEERKFAEAEALLREVLKICPETWKEDDPHRLALLNVLAMALHGRHQYAEAEAILTNVLQASERVQGETHPETLAAMNNLAMVLQEERKYDQAESLLLRALAIGQRTQGEGSPATLAVMYCLTQGYLAENKLAKAAPLIDKLLQYCPQVFGEENPRTFLARSNALELFGRQHNDARLESLLPKVIETGTRLWGEGEDRTLMAVNELALLRYRKKQYAEAEPLFAKVVDGLDRLYGPEYPDTLTALRSLIATLEIQGKFPQAEPLLLRKLKATESKHGRDSQEAGTDLFVLGRNLVRRKRYHDAEPYLRRCLKVCEKHPNPSQKHVAQGLLGEALTGEKRYAGAEPLLLASYEGLKSLAKTAPDMKPQVAKTVDLIVQLYENSGQKDKAAEWRNKRGQ
jgi:tetratricopeptide (TPR) repeat protein